MPLADHFPVLDDRRFEQLVQEARARIPRYAPEWTDLNESDPGMALVQLCAWLTELLLRRLGKVPKLNYLKFLELVGFELAPARAAVAEIGFPVTATHAEPYVIVPLRTQVATDQPDELGPVIFETERALVALTAKLDAVQAHDGYAFRDVTAANDGAEAGFEPLGPRATPGSGLYLGFSSNLEFPARAEVDLAFWVKAGQTGGALTCGGAAVVPAARLAWEHWDGKSWAPLDVLEDGASAFGRSGHVRLLAPPAGRMAKAAVGQVKDARYWIRARVIDSAYQAPPRLLAVRTNTVAATQAQTVEYEVLGGSSGRPDQTFTLSGRPVLEGSLVLEVDEGEGFQPWTEVPDFFGSGRDDPHYVLNRSLGEVRFGGRLRGRIPVANATRTANIRARRYRFGGGARGNVGARRITALMAGLAGIDAAKIANLFPSGGGSEEETLTEAIERAPAALKSRNRAVTAGDFEQLALQAGPVARARALPLHHPGFPGVDVPGVVTVVVVPEPADAADTAPLPTEATLRQVCVHLDRHRLLTTEVLVAPPRYRRIQIKADLVAEDGADLAAVKQRALAVLGAYLHPVWGGEDASPEERGGGWAFGRDVSYSLVVRRLIFAGTRRVASLEILVDGERCAPCTDACLEPDMLPVSGEHEISVRYEEA